MHYPYIGTPHLPHLAWVELFLSGIRNVSNVLEICIYKVYLPCFLNYSRNLDWKIITSFNMQIRDYVRRHLEDFQNESKTLIDDCLKLSINKPKLITSIYNNLLSLSPPPPICIDANGRKNLANRSRSMGQSP